MSQEGMNNPLAIANKGVDVVKDNIKPIVTVGATIAALYIGYRLYQSWNPTGLSIDSRKEPSNITTSNAATIAERLYQAMYAAGTDEKAIYAALEGLNHNDFVKVAKEFGLRSYFYITGEAPVFDWMGAKLNLVEWLTQELSTEEMARLKQILPEVF